jgi:enoyl-CoA hydratase/carnithine racemase
VIAREPTGTCASLHGSQRFSVSLQAFGPIPGACGIQHLTRLMGHARALEVMSGAEDDAECGTLRLRSKALTARHLASRRFARRSRLKAMRIALALADDFRRDLDLFLRCAHNAETQRRCGSQ